MDICLLWVSCVVR